MNRWIKSLFSYLVCPWRHTLTEFSVYHAQMPPVKYGVSYPGMPWLRGYPTPAGTTPYIHVVQRAAARSAISTTFANSMARVIGPTPPGLGV